MRWKGIVLVVALLSVGACASFTAAPDAPTNDGGVPIIDGSAPGPDASSEDGALLSPSRRTPPVCAMTECSGDLPGQDCKDDDCASDAPDFSAQGAFIRDDQCKVTGAVGRFERERLRGDTPDRLIELGFLLVKIDPVASAKIATLQVRGSDTQQAVLLVERGRMKLCEAATPQNCTAPVPLPTGKRVQFYGVFGGEGTALPSFGVSIDCVELLRLDMKKPFAAGLEVFASVGCLNAPCDIVLDDLVLLTRP